jgi:hypothetical protein
MSRKLPRFEPIGVEEGRAWRRKYRGNHDVERMQLELAHGRQIFGELEIYFAAMQRVWQAENLGQLVALEKTRLLLVEQNLRRSALAGRKPPPRRGETDEPEPALVDKVDKLSISLT